MSLERENLPNPEEFSPSSEIMPVDKPWLESLGVHWPDDDAEEYAWLEEINQIVETGSQHIDQASSEYNKELIISARESFFEQLHDIPGETIEAFREHTRSLIPLDTFIHTQRVLYKHDINLAKVLNIQPALFRISASTVESRINKLQEYGLTPSSVANAMPSVFGYEAEALEGKLENLNNLDLNAVKIVNSSPVIIGLAPEKVREKVHFLTERGFDATKLINKEPSLLYFPIESIQHRLQNIADLGIDPATALNKQPLIMTMAPESIETKMNFLTELGIDAVKLVNKQPNALAYAESSILEKIKNLSETGLDAIHIINSQPSVIGLSPDNIKTKITTLYAAGRAWGWGYYKHDINRFINEVPSVLTNSRARIRTLIRIASYGLPHTEPSAVSSKDVRKVVLRSLEETMVAYLKNKSQINEIADIARYADSCRSLGKKALKTTIERHPEDPVVKIYLRDYRTK